MKGVDLASYLSRVVAYVGPHLPLATREPFDPEENPPARVANYSLAAGGKKLRAALTFMAADYYKKPWEDLLPIATAVEYIQTASLIFDDLPAQDNSDTRRGRPAAHIAYPEYDAQLGALLLFTEAHRQVTSPRWTDPATQVAIQQYLCGIIAGTFHGQSLDLALPGQTVDLSTLERINFLKTSPFLEFCLVPVAMMAGALQTDGGVWRLFAKKLGVAYQIRDDLFDVEGDPARVGKPQGRDQQNRHTTFIDLLGADGARARMNEYADHAIGALSPLSGDTSFFQALVCFATARDY